MCCVGLDLPHTAPALNYFCCVVMAHLFIALFAMASMPVLCVSALRLNNDLSYTKNTQRPTQLLMQTNGVDSINDPLLLRAARGEEIERVPVWMMRQAGRHMKVME